MTLIGQTSRLILREAREDDAEFLLTLVNEPSWRKFIADHSMREEKQVRDYIYEKLIRSYLQFGFGLWIVTLTDTTPVGLCGLLKRETHTDIELGFAFLEAHWGYGYAREASRFCIDYAFRHLQLTRILAITSPHNHRSIATLQKLGFQHLYDSTNLQTYALIRTSTTSL